MPPAKRITTTERPRAMPLRAKSARSFTSCSGETQNGAWLMSGPRGGRVDLGDSLVEVDGEDRRSDLTDEVRSGRGGVVVGSVEERLDGHGDRRVRVEIGSPQLLQRPAGEAGAGADGMEAVLLV